MSSDFLGFGALAIGTIGTVAMTKEVVNAIKTTSNPPRRRMKSKPMRLKNKKGTNKYSIERLSRLG